MQQINQVHLSFGWLFRNLQLNIIHSRVFKNRVHIEFNLIFANWTFSALDQPFLYAFAMELCHVGDFNTWCKHGRIIISSSSLYSSMQIEHNFMLHSSAVLSSFVGWGVFTVSITATCPKSFLTGLLYLYTGSWPITSCPSPRSLHNWCVRRTNSQPGK